MRKSKTLRLAKSFLAAKPNADFSLHIRTASAHSSSSQHYRLNDHCDLKTSITSSRPLSTTTESRHDSLTGRNSRLYIYPELSKYRLSALVVVTSGAGFLCAGAPIDICTLTAVTIGTAFCAASAGTFNQVIEQGHDAKMLRTRLRPLPSGRIGTNEALTWGFSSGIAGTALLYTGEIENKILSTFDRQNDSIFESFVDII